MRLQHFLRFAFAAVFALLALVTQGFGPSAGHAQTPPTSASNVTVFATGLDNPRGLRFGPDGNLYVAEAGHGGHQSTVGLTQSAAGSCGYQVPGGTGGPGPGPFTGGYTARITQFTPSGARTTVVDGLPSTVSGDGHSSVGVADIEFVQGNLYALMPGGGCAHGHVDVPSSVIRVNPDGTWTIVANLSRFLRANPVPSPDASDYDPEGTWYSMLNVNGDLFAVNPNTSEIDKISPLGDRISRLVEMSGSPWIGPTSIAYRNGNFYVGNLGEFPIHPGTQNIYQITPSGQVSTFATGLTTVVGVAFDPSGQLYALELSAAAGGPRPGAGQVVRITSTGVVQTVASGLSFPTGMTFGPDGALYVSSFGAGPTGAGQILRVQVTSP